MDKEINGTFELKQKKRTTHWRPSIVREKQISDRYKSYRIKTDAGITGELHIRKDIEIVPEKIYLELKQ